jgi:CRP-like cAMP-binding protein
MRRIRQAGKFGLIRIDFFRKTRLIRPLDRNKKRNFEWILAAGSSSSPSALEIDPMVLLSTDQSARFLASPLLSGIEEEARLAIFQCLVEVPLEAGTPLLFQGRPNDRLWFVLEGSVAIERKQADGQVDVLASMSGPAIFGTTTFFRASTPTASIRATTRLILWTLDRQAHEKLRRDNPRASEALTLAILRVLSERFDLLDDRITELMAEHGDDHPRANEWANFRSRLFEDPAL